MAGFQSVIGLGVSTGEDWMMTAPLILTNAMMALDLKKRDKGSTSVGQKAKSLIARWFSKIEVKELVKRQLPPGTSTSAVLGPLFPRIERDVIVRVNRKGSPVAEDFAVLAVFNKHYNKWLMLSDNFPEWKRNAATASITKGVASNKATARSSESGTSETTGKAASSKKKRTKTENEDKYRLLLRMLLYDAEMSQFFEYTEVNVEKGNSRKEVFRLVELSDVIDVIGKLVTA
jgi:hypothetical protein